jgi:flagellar motility protein MotE (MotC chaperone)
MNGRQVTRLLLLTCVAVTVAAPRPLEAQFGGLRGRITDAAKKAAGAEEAPKPADKATVSKPVVLPTDDPMVIPITDAVLVAFATSLRTEIALKEELFKELEGQEEAVKKYEACQGQVAGSPEALEIMMQLGNMPDNATNEQLTQVMAKMGKDQEALILKMCGPKPAPVNTADRLSQIQQKAAAASGPVR